MRCVRASKKQGLLMAMSAGAFLSTVYPLAYAQGTPGPSASSPAIPSNPITTAPDANSAGLLRGNPVDQLPKVNINPSTTDKVQVEIEKKSSPLQTIEQKIVNIKEYQIQGVSSIDFKEISALFTPLTNKDIQIKSIIEATQAATKIYKDKGYVLSFAFLPQQTFENGTAKIVVVEGYVKDIKVIGETSNNEARIKDILEHLKKDKPLTQKTFERVDGILALQPGLSVSLNVPAPTTTEGGTTVEAKIIQKKYDVNVGLQAQKPDSQLMVSATVNSLTPLGDQLTVSALVPSGDKNARYYGLNYAVPLNANGLIGKIDITNYKEKPEAPALLAQGYQSQYENSTERVSFGLSYPLILESKRNWNLNGGLYLNREGQVYRPQNTVLFPNFAPDTKLSVLFLETSYIQRHTKSTTQLNAALSKGTKIFGAETVSTDDDIDFTKLKLQAQQNYTLPKDFEVRVKGIYQYSPDKLARSERISFGQRSYGAGYQAGEIEGDKGWGLSGELNYTWKTDYTYLKVVQPYIGYEIAKASYNRPVPSIDLKSALLGTRFSNNKNYFLDFSIGKPLGRTPSDGVNTRYGLTYALKF